MPDRPSRDGRTSESTSGSEPAESTAPTSGSEPAESADPTGESDSRTPQTADEAGSPSGVDEAVQRRLREAYLNDEEAVLVVTAVRSVGDAVAIEMQPPHGGATHVERFPAPRRGSLSESEAFLRFLDAAGVSPLDVDGLIGERIPATYDGNDGWRIDDAYLRGRDDGPAFRDDSGSADGSNSRGDSDPSGRVTRSLQWADAHRYWLLAGALIVGELAFIAVVVLLYA